MGKIIVSLVEFTISLRQNRADTSNAGNNQATNHFTVIMRFDDQRS